MDYKVVTVLAVMVVSASSLPYEPPSAIGSKSPLCPCAKIYIPLCGSDGKTYSNACEFNCQARHVRQLFGTEMFVVKKVRCEESE